MNTPERRKSNSTPSSERTNKKIRSTTSKQQNIAAHRYNSSTRTVPTPDATSGHPPRRPSVNMHSTNAGYYRRSPLQSSGSDLKNNLKSQTPLNRQLRQKNVPSEPGTRRRTTKPQYYRIKEERKKSRSLLGKRVLTVLILYAILMPLSLGLFWMWLPRHTTPETRNYTYQIGPDNNVLSKKIYSWDIVRAESVYYLDMTGIAELCEMTTTGDSESMKYTVRANGETVEFVLGQSLAYINGIPERMEATCYIRNGKVYVPMDFVNRCFKGLNASLDTEKNKITVIRETDDETGNYLLLSFPFKQSETSSSIDFSSLDVDIQQEILLREQINQDLSAANPISGTAE